MRHQHLVSFFAEHLKCLTSLSFSSVKIAIATLKLMFIDTKIIYIFNDISYGGSAEIKNQYSERMGTISPSVLNLS